MAEFKDSLRALSLNADDVDGIREVSADNRWLVHSCMSLSNRIAISLPNQRTSEESSAPALTEDCFKTSLRLRLQR